MRPTSSQINIDILLPSCNDDGGSVTGQVGRVFLDAIVLSRGVNYMRHNLTLSLATIMLQGVEWFYVWGCYLSLSRD